MSAVALHEKTAAPKEEFFQYTNLGPLLFGLLVGGGRVHRRFACWVTSSSRSKQCLFSWLFAFCFFFTISAGSLFWILLHYAVDAEWSVVVRRILETMANSFRYLWIFFIPILIGAPKIYEWMNIPYGEDPALDGKRALLEPKFWAVRAVVYFSFFFTVVVPHALVFHPAGSHGRSRLVDQGARPVVRVDPVFWGVPDVCRHRLADEHQLITGTRRCGAFTSSPGAPGRRWQR